MIATPKNRYPCWTRVPASEPAVVDPVSWRDQAVAALRQPNPAPGRRWLTYGNGRSYGDVCLNNGQGLIATRGLDRIVHFDRERGEVTAEAGTTFAELLALVTPAGWFLPVTPGTRHVTLGGAVANDVHGKDHRVSGTFSRHVVGLELWRSDRPEPAWCSPGENPELFGATVGGLGLTGLITRVTLRLAKVPGLWVEEEFWRGPCLERFERLLAGDPEVDGGFPHQVAWLDASAPAAELGRGIFSRGRFAAGETDPLPRRVVRLPAGLPVPSGLLNRRSVDLLNAVRWERARDAVQTRVVSYEPFFYPLDALAGWGIVYGSRGFYQHQAVIPRAAGTEPVRELLRRLRAGGDTSFVTVLKALGPLPSPGLLSFPQEGYTLALDIPNRGFQTVRTLEGMDEVVRAAGGRLYAAKDSRQSPETFRAGYPRWEEFARLVDPCFSSSFWRRVTNQPA